MTDHTQCILCSHTSFKILERYHDHHLIKCRHCGMVFSRQIPSKEDLDNVYYSYSYTASKSISAITVQRYKGLLKSVEPFRKNNRLLDYGCGRGDLLRVAKQMGWEVYGYEYSETALALLSKSGIKAIHPDEFKNIQPDFFDVVFANEVLEHLSYPLRAMEEMRYVLRPGGCCYITVPNFNSAGRMFLKEKYPVIAYPEHVSYFTKSTLRKALQKTGFRNFSIVSTGLNPQYLKLKRKNHVATEASDTKNSLEETRVAFESPLLRPVKMIINFFLNLFRKGETLKARIINTKP